MPHLANSSLEDRPTAVVVPLHSRSTLTEQRSSRRLTLQPKYGHGTSQVDVRYQWTGASDAPTIIVQGGISADRYVAGAEQGKAGWWSELVGHGQAIDLAHCRVLSIDWLTPADFGNNPRAISSEDQADALAGLVDALGIGRVAAFVGSSYGAMTALAFAARHPDKLEKLVLLAGAHRAHPMATAQRAIQRQILRLGQASGQISEALSLARQLAMTTYRGSEEFARRFDSTPDYREGRFHFPVEDYLEHAGRSFVQRFDLERFLALSESIDLHDVAPESVNIPAALIGFPSDRLVPLADLCELQRRLRGSATLEVVDSPYGHDAFLKETNKLAPLLRQAISCRRGA
ncbi:homoserine O-succinyltransferase MetX [Dyella nitratireducens]|uniref:Homoserine O-acetyltransferase n=1 Tax=Dyella nitratireducens TaxID=1849580 RepID=A0ABQ1GWK5_9GAMM|nr:homoserine O-succinyltransferase [Dyella nitratireducens]GGA51240.1 homoserine O-acetyltransferase [Dyella nitratireducens]GLQ42701.1 homoserine O-acetyltransferase [Dyella nitratireducens]